jgi:hypothetical protein
MTEYEQLLTTTLPSFMSIQDGEQAGQVFRMEYENFDADIQTVGISGSTTTIPAIKLTVLRLDPTPVDSKNADELYDGFVAWVTSHANHVELTDLTHLPFEINKASMRIAMGTRRGAATFMVIPFGILETCMTQLGDYFKPVAQIEKPSLVSTLPHLIGVMHGTINVFVDPKERTDNIIIGYASKNHTVDTAYIVRADGNGYAVCVDASEDNPTFKPARYYETLSV